MDPLLVRALAVVGGLLLVVLIGRLWTARDGRVRTDERELHIHDGHLDALGLDLRGASAGAVLLGSASCAPCHQVKQVLGELQSERDDFRWVYADAADHLRLAEEHAVMRVPTLFVLEPSGRIVARTSGVPRSGDLRRVLDGDPSEDLVA